jgi:hypothetical protein
VGVFSSIKANWRALLTKYKEKNPKQAGITKVEFPRLLPAFAGAFDHS